MESLKTIAGPFHRFRQTPSRTLRKSTQLSDTLGFQLQNRKYQLGNSILSQVSSQLSWRTEEAPIHHDNWRKKLA